LLAFGVPRPEVATMVSITAGGGGRQLVFSTSVAALLGIMMVVVKDLVLIRLD
jgi:hypothetical protein